MRDSWEAKSISELCNVKGGKRLPAGEEFDLGKTPFPYLRVTNMVNGSIDDSDLKYVKIEIEPLIRNYKISKNDLYVTIAGTLGNFGSIPDHLDNAQLTENAAKLCDINFEIISKKYLKYYLNSRLIEDQIFREIGVGGGVPKLAIHRIQSLKVNLPKKLSQQKKIAQILSTCDAVLEKTEASIAKYQALKQGLMHDLFTRGIDVGTGQLRPGYKDAPNLYKETDLGFVPKEWEVETISKNSSLVTNGFVGVATPFYTDKEKGVRYLFGTNVRADRLDFRDLRFVTKEFHKSKLKSNLKAGDMLTVQSGHIGTSAVIPKDFGEANCHALIITRFNLNVVNSNYISYYLNSALGIKGLEKLFIGSTIKHINTSDLAKHQIPIPKIKEQNIVVEKLKKSDEKIYTEQQSLAKYTQIKAGLMQDLLSGKVGVEGLLDNKKLGINGN